MQQHYIMHEQFEEDGGDISYFGPFDADEIEDRMVDDFGTYLEESGELTHVVMDLGDNQIVSVNDSEVWYEALESINRGGN